MDCNKRQVSALSPTQINAFTTRADYSIAATTACCTLRINARILELPEPLSPIQTGFSLASITSDGA